MEWFKNWFDSSYYHLLYKHRDQQEANIFMENLLNFLQPEPHDKILDLACGKGRHSLYIAGKGFDVCGVDLSQNNIKEALDINCKDAEFYVHDMRKPFRINYFNYVFNLFTSFGYFDNSRDELNTIESMALDLQPGGKVVIDFFNAEKVSDAYTKEPQYKEVEGIKFKWAKTIENKTIVKQIEVNDKGNIHYYQERVRLLKQEDFESYFKKCGLKLIHTFGNYRLQSFDAKTSERLILIAVKIDIN